MQNNKARPLAIGLMVLGALIRVTQHWNFAPVGALSLYAAACLGQGIVAGFKKRSLAAALWTAALVPAGHLSFGLGCWLFPFMGPCAGS